MTLIICRIMKKIFLKIDNFIIANILIKPNIVFGLIHIAKSQSKPVATSMAKLVARLVAKLVAKLVI